MNFNFSNLKYLLLLIIMNMIIIIIREAFSFFTFKF